MACPPTNVKFQLRRATSAQWASANPILKAGEPGIDTTVNGIKIGDGIRQWSILPFVAKADAASIIFDGGLPTTNYSNGTNLDCGSVT